MHDGADKSNHDRDHIDRQLELQKLGDTVIDVAAPLHSLYISDTHARMDGWKRACVLGSWSMLTSTDGIIGADGNMI